MFFLTWDHFILRTITGIRIHSKMSKGEPIRGSLESQREALRFACRGKKFFWMNHEITKKRAWTFEAKWWNECNSHHISVKVSFQQQDTHKSWVSVVTSHPSLKRNFFRSPVWTRTEEKISTIHLGKQWRFGKWFFNLPHILLVFVVFCNVEQLNTIKVERKTWTHN